MKVALKKVLTVLLLISVLMVGACSSPPSRFDQAQQESTQVGKAVAKDAVGGDSFNKFFPQPGGGYERVYTQEKKGFAEAKLKKSGKDVAMLSISDTSSNPSAASKFQQSSETIKGYPTVEQGSTGSAVLVADRFQVKVLSRDPSFTKTERQEWLAKFDLNGLARVK